MSKEIAIVDEAALSLERFTLQLNQDPNPKWMKKTPDNKAFYIPIGVIENELRTDFRGLVQFELISERRELNEYVVHARIKVFHPIILQWLNFDGIGCIAIMQNKDTTIATFAENKKKNALEMNAPNAYAEAIKNAAKKIGTKYGANINRDKEETYYQPEDLISITIDDIIDKINDAKTADELGNIWALYPEFHKSNTFKTVFSNAKSQLK